MTMMIPVIMNTAFQRLGIIDNYISFIWTTRFYTCGDFELVVTANANNFALFKKDYYIVRDEDEHAGIIEDIVLESDEDGQEIMIVTGRFLSSILDRRIIAVQTTLDGTVSEGVNQLIDENIMNPSITGRKIANFTVGDHNVTDELSAQYTGKNLLDVVTDICKTYGVGMKTVLDSSHNFVFDLIEGVDHTYDQDVLPYVVFSDRYDNLLESRYEEDYTNIVTAVLVAGEGEGLNRKTLWVANRPTGLDRREVYLDQRQLQSNGGEIGSTAYNDLMRQAGKERLTRYTAAFTGTVDFTNVKYRDDVNIGDLVVIENSKWGIYMNTRLVEVIESVSETGDYKIVPTFGV